MDRRTFFQSAATLTAASYGRVMGANDRVGVALIGTGRRGTLVGQAFAESGRAELRSLCDLYDKHLTAAREKLAPHGNPQLTAEHEDVLANKEVDAVILAVPDHLHVSLAKQILGAKKHLYLEKPVIHRWPERLTLMEAARESGKILQCGTQQRSGSHYIRAKEEIFDSGKLGRVVFARAVWSNFPWQCRQIPNVPQPAGLDWQRFLGPSKQVPFEMVRYDSWRYFPDYGGGLLADILTHWADVAQWMLNDAAPLSAQAAGGIYAFQDQRQNPDTVNAILQYKNWNLSFESSVLPIKNDVPSVFFEGTQGTLDLSRNGYVFQPNKGTAQKVDAEGPLENAHAVNFLEAVLHGKPISAGLESGIDACRPVQMALESYWKRKMVWAQDFS